ncbi:MAG: anthrone oxygenase family protein, partial [Pseudomonadota bacterium]
MIALTHLCIILFGMMTGFFYAYSVSVVPGLDVSDPGAAVEAMRGINVAVRNPVFFATFFLAPFAALLAGCLYLRAGALRPGAFLIASAFIYVLGAIGPTSLINAPMNDALAVAEVTDAAAVWDAFAPDWTL